MIQYAHLAGNHTPVQFFGAALRSLTVVRMEVPCCGGIQRAAATALEQSGKDIPFQVITLSTDGQVLA